MSNFNYLIDKIRTAEFSKVPFRHIYIENFFDSAQFQEIISSCEIAVPKAADDDELIDGLYENGYKIINFPGCISDRSEYVAWHQNGRKSEHHTACEGFGMTLRLYETRTPIINEVKAFFESEIFNNAIAEKFNLDFKNCTIDGGIQKYLDGYEISPHPDIRRKAATFMVNINPSDASETANHHTHYLKFKPERDYIRTFWEGNPTIDRAWVPWEWADTIFNQTKNNTVVLFSPSNDTMHAVRANYNHLVTQRTQLYGNLWYKENPSSKKREWEELDLLDSHRQSTQIESMPWSLKPLIKSTLPTSLLERLRNLRGIGQGACANNQSIGKRNM